MSWIILFLLTLVLFGAIAGMLIRSVVVRVITTLVFAVCWLTIVWEADRSHDASVIWGAWGIGVALFLFGLGLTSRMQRAMTLDDVAEASTQELHEGLLSLIDAHGDGGNRWLQHEWMIWAYERQREWVRRHRTKIKRELAAAVKARGSDPARFWTRMASLDVHRCKPPASAHEELVWDANVLVPDGSMQAISIFADSVEEAQQMLLSHYGPEAIIQSMQRNRSS
jgi:hypothetical protein